MGADVWAWYREMPRVVQSSSLYFAPANVAVEASSSKDKETGGRVVAYDVSGAGRMTLTDHYRSDHCLVCGRKTEHGELPSPCASFEFETLRPRCSTLRVGVCIGCRQSPRQTMSALSTDTSRSTSRLISVMRVCASCAGTTGQASACSSSADPQTRTTTTTTTTSSDGHRIPPPPCISIDCPVLYDRVKAKRELVRAAKIYHHVEVVLEQQ